MEAKDVLTFLFQRADATQTFWNFFATVVVAILGFLAAAKPQWLTRTMRGVLTFGFLVFAGANLFALNIMRMQRAALLEAFPKTKNYEPGLSDVAGATSPSGLLGLLLFHLSLDMVIIALIWAIPHIRTSSAAEN